MLIWFGLGYATVNPPRPVFAESFSVSTIEIDDTLNGSISVTQVLRRDSVTHRSWMSANGTLVSGGEEQIMRCDMHPEGWLIVAGGADEYNVSSWSCTNQTIDSDPEHCQWNPFWSLPHNASFAGQELVDGRAANRWNYWSSGEQMAMWASLDGMSPIATGKVWTSHPGYHLWHILWRDFIPGPPPLPAFALTEGIKCGLAPPLPPPPAPFKPATDCKPGCGSGALCCQDPSAPPSGACFNVQGCVDLPGRTAIASGPRMPRMPRMPRRRTLQELHMEVDHRTSGG